MEFYWVLFLWIKWDLPVYSSQTAGRGSGVSSVNAWVTPSAKWCDACDFYPCMGHITCETFYPQEDGTNNPGKDFLQQGNANADGDEKYYFGKQTCRCQRFVRASWVGCSPYKWLWKQLGFRFPVFQTFLHDFCLAPMGDQFLWKISCLEPPQGDGETSSRTNVQWKFFFHRLELILWEAQTHKFISWRLLFHWKRQTSETAVILHFFWGDEAISPRVRSETPTPVRASFSENTHQLRNSQEDVFCACFAERDCFQFFIVQKFGIVDEKNSWW